MRLLIAEEKNNNEYLSTGCFCLSKYPIQRTSKILIVKRTKEKKLENECRKKKLHVNTHSLYLTYVLNVERQLSSMSVSFRSSI